MVPGRLREFAREEARVRGMRTIVWIGGVALLAAVLLGTIAVQLYDSTAPLQTVTGADGTVCPLIFYVETGHDSFVEYGLEP
jgi:hypothetical protein